MHSDSAVRICKINAHPPARTLFIKIVALLAVATALLAQARNPSPRELLNTTSPLTIAQVDSVLKASQLALTGKTFRLVPIRLGQAADVLMRSAGQPRILRMPYSIESGSVGGIPGSPATRIETRSHEDFILMYDFTGRPARHCDGSVELGEMVIEYRFRSSTRAWTATARRWEPRHWEGHRVAGFAIPPAFEMLSGAGDPVSGERGQIDGRRARALVSLWVSVAEQTAHAQLHTGDPLPNVVGEPAPSDAIQSLWIDTESLLPLRWDVSRRDVLDYGFDFKYGLIALRPPAGIAASECID